MNKTQPPEFMKENRELNIMESNRPFQKEGDKKKRR